MASKPCPECPILLLGFAGGGGGQPQLLARSALGQAGAGLWSQGAETRIAANSLTVVEQYYGVTIGWHLYRTQR